MSTALVSTIFCRIAPSSPGDDEALHLLEEERNDCEMGQTIGRGRLPNLKGLGSPQVIEGVECGYPRQVVLEHADLRACRITSQPQIG